MIGKIARLFHLKGHEDVLRAFAEVAPRAPAARLLFVGDGILRDRLSALAASLGIAGKVTFAGLVSPERIPEMIKAMDLLVHASLREGLARVLPQALLSGCPVISYDVDGAREVVRDGVTGFLVPAGSVAGLREAMLRALATSMPRARWRSKAASFSSTSSAPRPWSAASPTCTKRNWPERNRPARPQNSRGKPLARDPAAA